jgi:two-component sensor histidine kinase
MEVYHRAKNVLAIVDSLVRLSRADDVAQYAAAVQQRIQALSQPHALLSERGWKDVGLRDVVEGQIARYRGKGILFDGPELAVAPAMVQPLALIIHELAANAAVHGALPKSGGRLILEWERINDTGGFRLLWTESGSPPVADNPKPGFGTVMVKALVEKQLSGHVKRVWQDRGLKILLEVPGIA